MPFNLINFSYTLTGNTLLVCQWPWLCFLLNIFKGILTNLMSIWQCLSDSDFSLYPVFDHLTHWYAYHANNSSKWAGRQIPPPSPNADINCLSCKCNPPWIGTLAPLNPLVIRVFSDVMWDSSMETVSLISPDLPITMLNLCIAFMSPFVRVYIRYTILQELHLGKAQWTGQNLNLNSLI